MILMLMGRSNDLIRDSHSKIALATRENRSRFTYRPGALWTWDRSAIPSIRPRPVFWEWPGALLRDDCAGWGTTQGLAVAVTSCWPLAYGFHAEYLIFEYA